MKVMYPEVTGGLAPQDDRYHTVPCRYGSLIGGVEGVPRRKGAGEGDGSEGTALER